MHYSLLLISIIAPCLIVARDYNLYARGGGDSEPYGLSRRAAYHDYLDELELYERDIEEKLITRLAHARLVARTEKSTSPPPSPARQNSNPPAPARKNSDPPAPARKDSVSSTDQKAAGGITCPKCKKPVTNKPSEWWGRGGHSYGMTVTCQACRASLREESKGVWTVDTRVSWD